MHWARIHKGDSRGRELADLHYTRQSPGHPMWTRPGYNFTLYAAAGIWRAVWCWWRPKWEGGQERKDGLRALECTIFRLELPPRAPRPFGLASRLVDEAIWKLLSPEAEQDLSIKNPWGLQLISGVGSKQTADLRGKTSLPGKCFRDAGFVELPHRKGKADVWLHMPAIF